MASTRPVRKWSWLVWLVVASVAALVVPTIGVFKAKHRQDALHERGVQAPAVVVATEHSGSTDYLIVNVESCACRLAVATSNVAAHPIGSSLPIRYDPQRPSTAEALVNRANPYETFLVALGSIVFGVLVVVPIVVVSSRHLWRSRALLDVSTPTGTVRVELWRRSMLGGEIAYLSVYEVDSPPGSSPLLCMPVEEQVATQIEESDLPPRFEAFGSLVAGQPLALRQGDLAVTAGGQTKDAAWEAHHRRQSRGSWDAATGPLLRDAREARSHARSQKLVLAVFLALMPLSLIQIVPERFLTIGVVVVFAGVALAIGTFWHHLRVLDRLGQRMAGPTGGRGDRRAARSAAARWLRSPAGEEEMASLLGLTVEERKATERRVTRWAWLTATLTFAVFILWVVQFALS